MGQELSCGLNRKFGELFDSAVDKAMVLLGESGRQATYYYLEKILGLERGRWHNHVEEFAEAVEQIFGSGAQLLLKAIAKELYLNLGLEFDEPKKFNFAKLVREAERYFLTTPGGGNLLKKKGKVLESVGNESEKTRMLVVDEDIRRVLTEILEGEGYVVDSVGTSTTSILKSNERAFP